VYAGVVSGEHGRTDEARVGPAVDDGYGAERVGLTGWIDTFGSRLTPAWRRRLGSAVVAAVGGLLVGIPFYHLVRHGASIEALVGDAVPLVFGLLLLGTGAWVGWLGDDDLAPLVTAFWVTVGLVVTGLVTLYFFTLHAAHGHVVESSWFLVYDVSATGAVAGLLISRYDVRSRRRHRRLSQQERRFRAVFEGTLDALVVVDDEGRYLDANPAAADLFGLPRVELIGMHVADFAPDDLPAGEHWAQFVRGTGQRGEYELVRADGEARTVSVAAAPNVRPGRHLAVLRDVTDRVEREADLDRERARVEFLNRLLRHNVLNGMNLVLAKLDALEPSVPAAHRDDVEAARHRGEEIVDLIQTARRLATDVSSEGTDRRLDVRAPLTDAVADLQTAHPEAAVDCNVPEKPVWVRADGMVETVFEHLLTNSVQHNDPASIHVTATVSVDPETVTVTVADDGDGVSPDRLARLFDEEPFAHTRDWGGFGLSIVQALVREYDGRVWAEANEPSGIVVVVELPRAAGPDGECRDSSP